MPTAIEDRIISDRLSVEAAQYRILALEADIQSLRAIRTDTAKIKTTEDAYRAKIVRQARCRKYVRTLEKEIAKKIAADALTVSPDAELVSLCDQLVAGETETARLIGDTRRLKTLIEKCAPPTTEPGRAAVARLALAWVDHDSEGNPEPADLMERLTVMLAQAAVPDFVWPPRPGTPMAHRSPSPSPEEHEKHCAAARRPLAQELAQ